MSTVREGPVDRTREPAPLEPKPFHFPSVSRTTLPNGLRVCIATRTGLPLVSAMIAFEYGGTEDPVGEEGLADMTSRLLSEGAGERSATELAEEADQLGLSLDHASGWDSSVVRMRMLRHNLEPALSLMGDMAMRPHFHESEFERERDLRLAEIQSDLDDPRSIVIERSSRFVFGTHRYGTPLAGTDASIRLLHAGRLKERHAQKYRPGIAYLLLVGDLTVDEGMELAGKYFGGWEGSVSPRGPVAPTPALPATRICLVDKPGSAQSEIRIAQPGVTRDDPDYFKLLVLNAVLGEAFGSRLYFNLREKNGFTYGAGSNFQMRRGRGPFVASAAVGTEVTDKAVVEFMREIRGIREIAPTDSELRDAKGYLSGGLAVDLQSNGSVADRISEAELFRLPHDHMDHYRDRILAVTSREVIATANRAIDPDHLVITVVGDAEKIRPGLETLMPVEIYDVMGTPK